jgi:HEAT repeat protein
MFARAKCKADEPDRLAMSATDAATEEKLALVEELALKLPIATGELIELSRDDDAEVRFRAIEALSSCLSTQLVRTRLREALQDSDDLVRATTVEALGDSGDRSFAPDLIDATSDPSELVRSAALIGVGQVGSREATWMLERTLQQTGLSTFERLSAEVALYMLGRRSGPQAICGCLSSDDYRLRCASANLIKEFVKPNDIPYVVACLRSALKTEVTRAARSSIENALDALVTSTP